MLAVPKLNAFSESINTWWNGYRHFTQPRFSQTVTPKIINWKTKRTNHSNISFMGGIYYEKWKTSVEFSNNWLLAEFVLSAARVAPEGVGRAVAVEESKKKVSWVLWSRSRFGWVLTTSPNEARYLENCSSVSLTSNTSHSNRHWGKNRGLYSSLSSYIHT